MTQIAWTQPAGDAVPGTPAWPQRLASRLPDWEDWLTFGLALGAMLGVSLSLEDSGWSRDMPAITLVGFLALLFAMVIGRSRMHMLLAWPLAAVAGAAVTFWQTLNMVGPGDLWQRIDAIYFRFQAWFEVAFNGGISNDSLPFNVMVVGLTWLGVFVFGWSVFRWHNAWLGLIPGGVALFLNFVFIDDSFSFPVFLFVLFGMTLVMRTNVVARIRAWRAEGVPYPPYLSLTALHYTLWAVLFLLGAAWIAPVGPFETPGAVSTLVERFEGMGVHFVRLAGPLHAKKIVPVHDYTAVLPFQGSIDLSERELLLVEVADPTIGGPIALRGAVYDEYASGGWKAGPREEVDVAFALGDLGDLGEEGSGGRIVPVTVTVDAKSVVGTVLFIPGQPLSADVPAEAKLLEGSLIELPVVTEMFAPLYERRGPIVVAPSGGRTELSDEDVLELAPPGWTGLYVRRDAQGRADVVGAVRTSGLPDVLVLSPEDRLKKGDSYSVLGVVPDIEPESLRAAARAYPEAIEDAYLQLPDLPQRVAELAEEIVVGEVTPYDKAEAVEAYLRANYPVDYAVGAAPPGQDTVDYFLFEARRGYFDHHASAMVVLLRTLGVPARLAVGFVIDDSDLDEEAGAYVVRQDDAYAWTEVYFPRYGWVQFNPSPDRPADLVPSEKDDEIIVPPLSLEDLEDLPVATGGFFPLDPRLAGGSGGSASTGGSGTDYTPWIALGVAAFLAAVAGSFALGWRRSVAGLPYEQQVWEKTVRLSSWAGYPPRPGETPSDFARGLSGRTGVWGIDLVADSYNGSRFGNREPDEKQRERLAGVWRSLRRRLAWEAVQRLWRRA